MNNQRQEHVNTKNYGSVITGMLIGGLVGAGTMLVFAPQSGKRTRSQILRKTGELRDQTAEIVEDAVSQAGIRARSISSNVSKQAKKLKGSG